MSVDNHYEARCHLSFSSLSYWLHGKCRSSLHSLSKAANFESNATKKRSEKVKSWNYAGEVWLKHCQLDLSISVTKPQFHLSIASPQTRRSLEQHERNSAKSFKFEGETKISTPACLRVLYSQATLPTPLEDIRSSRGSNLLCRNIFHKSTSRLPPSQLFHDSFFASLTILSFLRPIPIFLFLFSSRKILFSIRDDVRGNRRRRKKSFFPKAGKKRTFPNIFGSIR